MGKMIWIDNVYVEESILTVSFCCDLPRCLGACCVEGESGAPLNSNELEYLEKNYSLFRNYLPKKNQKIIEQNGMYMKDDDGDWTTPLTHKNGPCVYAVFENNIAYCAIEKAFHDKKISWQKPMSCHLYPIRVEYKNGFVYLRYHSWHVCQSAINSHHPPLFQFLKYPLIQYFGQKFFSQLENIYHHQFQTRKTNR